LNDFGSGELPRTQSAGNEPAKKGIEPESSVAISICHTRRDRKEFREACLAQKAGGAISSAIHTIAGFQRMSAVRALQLSMVCFSKEYAGTIDLDVMNF
jgi:hypothetical protein